MDGEEVSGDAYELGVLRSGTRGGAPQRWIGVDGEQEG